MLMHRARSHLGNGFQKGSNTMQDQKKAGIALVIFFASIMFISMVIVAIDSDGPNIERVGYYKSPSHFRVMSFKSPDPVTEQDARETLKNLMVTPGRATIAMIYVGTATAPADGVTFAHSYFEATSMVFDPPYNRWTWRMVISPSGRRALDHQQCPTDVSLPCGEIQNIFVDDTNRHPRE
ncbi:MAG: hypothetical protein H5U24_05720 [Thioclava marina]|uniref:hypothetical protein n=1 Tax=Thioclava marina TaxID=1915077 RepID=UPI0019ABD001|nr:hypothetical protein [Thioclava marina]MBC7144888.1 hypothetical protein [Thioclava marina]